MYIYTYKSMDEEAVFNEEESAIYKFVLQIRLNNDLKVNPILTDYGISRIINKIDGIWVKKENAREELHEKLKRKIVNWLSSEGWAYFPGRRKVDFRLETTWKSMKLEPMVTPWTRISIR